MKISKMTGTQIPLNESRLKFLKQTRSTGNVWCSEIPIESYKRKEIFSIVAGAIETKMRTERIVNISRLRKEYANNFNMEVNYWAECK